MGEKKPEKGGGGGEGRERKKRNKETKIRPGLRNMWAEDVGSASAFTVNVLSYADTPVLIMYV